jgi:hypothetical protein
MKVMEIMSLNRRAKFSDQQVSSLVLFSVLFKTGFGIAKMIYRCENLHIDGAIKLH